MDPSNQWHKIIDASVRSAIMVEKNHSYSEWLMPYAFNQKGCKFETIPFTSYKILESKAASGLSFFLHSA